MASCRRRRSRASARALRVRRAVGRRYGSGNTQQLVAHFRPFLEALVVSDLSPKTVQRHVDNIWALGGEIIRDLNEDPALRRKRIEQILDDRIDEEGGPLVYALESEEPLQRSLDSTCRKLYHFRKGPPGLRSACIAARAGETGPER